jgi:hypothetical protein
MTLSGPSMMLNERTELVVSLRERVRGRSGGDGGGRTILSCEHQAEPSQRQWTEQPSAHSVNGIANLFYALPSHHHQREHLQLRS